MKKREFLFGVTMSVKLDQCLRVVVVVIKLGSGVMLLKLLISSNV
jgi:hypothetical protein